MEFGEFVISVVLLNNVLCSSFQIFVNVHAIFIINNMNSTNKGLGHQDSNETEGVVNDRKESGKRGRKPGRKTTDKADIKARLERSRQSARECRARKKLRYQYLEELVADREKAVLALRKELDKYKSWGQEIDEGQMPEGIHNVLEEIGAIKQEK